MPLKYLIDENLRGKFTLALAARAIQENIVLDLLETGDLDAPPLGTPDDELLRWAQQHNRVLVSLDKNTIPDFLINHLASGEASPGVLLIRRSRNWDDILYFLVLYAEIAAPEECAGQCIYVPL